MRDGPKIWSPAYGRDLRPVPGGFTSDQKKSAAGGIALHVVELTLRRTAVGLKLSETEAGLEFVTHHAGSVGASLQGLQRAHGRRFLSGDGLLFRKRELRTEVGD